MEQPGKVANPAREYSLFPFTAQNFSRDRFGVLSRVSLLILHPQAESGAYSRD